MLVKFWVVAIYVFILFFCAISFKLLKIKKDRDKSREPVHEVHVKIDSHSQSDAIFLLKILLKLYILNMKKFLIVMAA